MGLLSGGVKSYLGDKFVEFGEKLLRASDISTFTKVPLEEICQCLDIPTCNHLVKDGL